MSATDSTEAARARLTKALDRRFGDAAPLPDAACVPGIAQMAEHRTHRYYDGRPVDPALLRAICAAALSAPSKSDLQQRDIVIVEDKDVRRRLDALIPGMDWLPAAPALVVVCANNRRQRQVHEWRGHEFANDHLDPFFNASTDAAIVLGWLVLAAEAVGLGCCPISVIRNNAQAVSDLLGLPEHVFAYAGLALGWPSQPGAITPRLPLSVTLHTDRFDERDVRAKIEAHDRRRASIQPYRTQRAVEKFGRMDDYGWSEEKARQYAVPERADFGAFIRRKGFDLR
ncbi:MAG: nitroreductase family protein [Alphaproteobacteria bacterium]|nr:nitroreductase family protein [Alphaproteobacteria bacterium]